MFNSTYSEPKDSYLGLKAIGVPGDLAGLHSMFNRFGSGKVGWEDLFEDAIDFARHGFPVGQHLNDALEQNRETIKSLKNMKDVYWNTQTDDLYKVGENFTQPTLAETLTNLSLARNPNKYFYEEIASKIMNDLRNNNDFPNQKPIITEEDFALYSVKESVLEKQEIDQNMTMYSATLPGKFLNAEKK